jgi:hypothetical protein
LHASNQKEEKHIMTKSTVHDHYVTCACGAHYSDPIAVCPACGKANPELPTLNGAEEPNNDPGTATTAPAPTLNGKEEP